MKSTRKEVAVKEINFSYKEINRDILRTLERPSSLYLVLIGLVLCGVAYGGYCWSIQIRQNIAMARPAMPQ